MKKPINPMPNSKAKTRNASSGQPIRPLDYFGFQPGRQGRPFPN